MIIAFSGCSLVPGTAGFRECSMVSCLRTGLVLAVVARSSTSIQW